MQPNFPQVIDRQMNTDLLNKIMDEEMISLSGGESNDDLLGFEVEENLENYQPPTKPSLIIDEFIDSSPTHRNQPYTKTTIASNLSHSSIHSSSSTFTTTGHSLHNTTTPILATDYHSTRQNKTPIHTSITSETNKSLTRHILQTLQKSTTITTTSTSTALPLYTPPKITPLSKTSIQPSTTT